MNLKFLYASLIFLLAAQPIFSIETNCSKQQKKTILTTVKEAIARNQSTQILQKNSVININAPYIRGTYTVTNDPSTLISKNEYGRFGITNYKLMNKGYFTDTNIAIRIANRIKSKSITDEKASVKIKQNLNLRGKATLSVAVGGMIGFTFAYLQDYWKHINQK